jgi:hypothetical protein
MIAAQRIRRQATQLRNAENRKKSGRSLPPDRGMSMLSFQPCTCVSLKSAPARSRSSCCTCSTMAAHKVVIDSHLSKLGSMPHRKGLESRANQKADYRHKEPAWQPKSDRSRIFTDSSISRPATAAVITGTDQSGHSSSSGARLSQHLALGSEKRRTRVLAEEKLHLTNEAPTLMRGFSWSFCFHPSTPTQGWTPP